jgi:hypothetical protein
MSINTRGYLVEGMAPALCVRLGADVVPGLIGCSCVRQTVVVTVPDGMFTAEVERGDGTLTIAFTRHRAPYGCEAGRAVSGAPGDITHRWRVAVDRPATPDRLAAVIAAEIASARDRPSDRRLLTLARDVA